MGWLPILAGIRVTLGGVTVVVTLGVVFVVRASLQDKDLLCSLVMCECVLVGHDSGLRNLVS